MNVILLLQQMANWIIL